MRAEQITHATRSDCRIDFKEAEKKYPPCGALYEKTGESTKYIILWLRKLQIFISSIENVKGMCNIKQRLVLYMQERHFSAFLLLQA